MRRAVQIGIIIAVLLALALGGAVFYLNSSFGKRHLLRIVNEKALAGAGLELGWSDVRGSFLYNFVARDPYLIASDGDTVVTADALRVRVRPRSILEGEIELLRVELDRPVVNVMALPEAEGDRAAETIAASDSTETEEERQGQSVRIGNIVLRNGTIRFDNPGVVSAVDGVTLRGAIAFGGGADFQIDMRRFRGVLLDWGLRVEDWRGQIILNRNLLWFIDNEINTRNSLLKANGNLDLSRNGRAGNLALDLQAGDLSEWWPIIGGDWIGAGSIHLAGRLRGSPDEPELALEGAGVLAGVELTRFDIRGAVRDGRVSVDLTAVGPAADSISATVTLDTGTGAGRLIASGVGLDLESSPVALALQSEWIDIDLTTTSFDPVTDGGRLLINASGTDLFGLRADSLAADLDLSEGNISLLAPLRMAGDGFSISSDGFVSLERGAVLLNVDVTTAEPSELLRRLGVDFGRGTLTLRARISGALDDPSLRGDVSAVGLEQAGVVIRGSSFDFNISQILSARIGTFFAYLESVHVDQDLALEGAMLDGRIQGERVILQLVTGWWDGGDVNLHGNISVDGDSIRARIDSGRLVHRELDVSNMSGQLAFDPRTGAGPFSVNLRTAGGTARVSGERTADNETTFTGNLQRIAIGPISRTLLDSLITIDGLLSGRMNARITRHLDELELEATVAAPTFGEYRYETLTLDARYDRGAVVIDDLTITGEADERGQAESAIIRGDFRLPIPDDERDQGVLNLNAEIESLRLDSFARYLDRTLIGTLSSDLAVSGTFSVPEIEGRIRLFDAQVDTFFIDNVEAGVRYLNERLYLEDGQLDALGFEASYSGSIPMIISLIPLTVNVYNEELIEARLTGTGPPDVLVQSIGEQIDQIGGNIQIDLGVSGSLSAPSMNGSFRWSEGTVKPAMLGQQIREIEVDLRLEDQRITVQRFTGRLPSDLRQRARWWNLWNLFGIASRKEPGGTFAISGNVLLREGESPLYALHLEGEEMGLSDPTGSVLVAVDADLNMQNVSGSEHPILEGTVQVQEGLADLGMVLNMIGSGGRETTEVEEERTRLETDIEIEIPGRLRVIGGEFGQDVDIELMGNLIVRKSATGSPYVLGTLEAVPGRGQLTIFGYRWAVDVGTVTFGSIEEINPDLNARFSTSAQDLLVYLDLTGTLREPQTRLSTAGNELTSESAIWELLTIGTIGISGQGGGTEVIGNYLERAASRTVRGILPVDEVELEGLSGLGSGLLSEDLQVSVGRYFGRRVYAQYARSLGGQTLWSEYGVEYRFSRRFSLSGMRDRNGRYLFEVKWRIDY